MLKLQQLNFNSFNSEIFLVYWSIYGTGWNLRLWPFQNGMFNVIEEGKIEKNEINRPEKLLQDIN